MTGRRFSLITFFLIIVSIYSYAQNNNKKPIAGGSYTYTNLLSVKKAASNPFAEEKTGADTIYPSLIKGDFTVNNFEGEFGADQINAASAIDGAGNYAVAWRDYRNGSSDVYLQFFNNKDVKIGPNIKFDQPADVYNPPSIAANNKGDFIIAWNRNNNTIGIQKFNIDGEKIEKIFETEVYVNYIYSLPSAAVIENGSFLLCWPGGTITAVLFDKTGNPVTSEIIVNETSNFSPEINPGKNIAADGSGKFCIVWKAYVSNTESNIYLQIIDSLGRKVDGNIIINDSNDDSYKGPPQIASTNDGYLLISWDYTTYISDIYISGNKIRFYNSDGHFVTNPLTIDDYPNKIISDGDSTFYISYLEYDNQSSEQQFIQKIKKNGEFLGNKQHIIFNTDNNFLITGTDLTNVVNDHFFIILQLNDRNDADIYIQKFDTDLNAAGSFTKVHDDSGSAYQEKSLVKFNRQGESIVLWQDKRNGRLDLYAQVFDKNFNPAGNNIMINETGAEMWYLIDKKVQSLSDGTFVAAYSGFQDYGSYNANVFLRLIKGENPGENLSVKRNEIYESELRLALNVNSKDQILVCWYNNNSAYLRKYDRDLNPLSPETKFIQYQNTNTINIYNLAVSIDSALNILAVGRISSSSSSKLAGKFFNEKGEETSHFFISDPGSSSALNIKCINENGNYAVVYSDYSKIYVTRGYYLDREYILNSELTLQNYAYEYSLNLIDFENRKLLLTFNSPPEVLGVFINDNRRESKIFNIHTYAINSPYGFYGENFGRNSTDFYYDKLFFTYEGANPGRGYDIMANVQKIDSIDFNEEPFLVLPVQDLLHYNYPNPFNSRTKISYEIAAFHRVKLTVYDILGREVKVLVDRYQERGTYEVDFDASGLASGIYFYRLEAFDTIVKKMILLK